MFGLQPVGANDADACGEPLARARALWSSQWGVEGNAFGGYNYQRREFTDFDGTRTIS